MKKLFLLFLCTCISLSFSFGQTSKGTKFWVVDGMYSQYSNEISSTYTNINATFSSNSSSTNSFSININKGKFYNNNLAHGWGITYNFNTKFNQNGDNNSNYFFNHENRNNIHTIGLNYFLIHFIPIARGFYFLGEVNARIFHDFSRNVNRISNYSSSDNWQFEETHTYYNDLAGFEVRGGIRYYPKSTFFINATTTLADANYNWSSNDSYQSNSLNFRGSLNFQYLKLGIGTNF